MFSSCLARRLFKLYSVNLLKSSNYTTSALYITGDKAHNTFAVLNPHLDFEERLQNKNELVNNLKLRDLNVNLDDIIRVWNFYKHVESKKNNLEDSRVSISQAIRNLATKGDKYAVKINNLKAHGKMVKEDLKALKDEFWSLEEKAAIKVLSLPNVLHNKTPESNSTVIHTFSQQLTVSSKSHLDIAKDLDLIEYISPYNYYLKNDAALFELGLSYYLTDKLFENNYSAFSNSDFTRSVIVEGCGLDFSNSSKVFAINEDDIEHKHENSRLHLTGGASLSSFMAHFCKHTVFPTQLPLKYFSVGKKYQPVADQSNSLRNVTQETAVHIFVAVKDDTKEMDEEFDKVLQDAIKIYESLGYHFRVCFLPAKDLQSWESLRASFQLYSSHVNEYLEVGNISLCGDYISKRLLFNYGKGYDVHYPSIISGTLISVPKLLSCVLESEDYSKKNLLPDMLKQYIEN